MSEESSVGGDAGSDRGSAPRRALVTGGTGFVGSHLVRLLVGRGDEVAVLARASSDPWRLADVLPRVRLIRGDLADLAPAAPALQDFAPAVVFHLGWEGVGNRHRDDPAQLYRNVAGTLRLLELAAAAGCRHFVGLGSQAEYGRHDRAIAEDAPAEPTTAYGAAKLCAGLLARQACRLQRQRFAWLRLFSTYGPADDPGWLIPYTILELLAGRRPALTRGEQRWDYLYVVDLVAALVAVADAPAPDGHYNLGSGVARPVREVVETIRDLIDPGLPLGLGDRPYAPDQIMHLEADVSRLVAATGWRPAWSLREGLAATVAWFREHRARYGQSQDRTQDRSQR